MREDVIRMARDSGMELYGLGKDREKFVYYLERFAELAASAEREACAKVCDSLEEQCEKLLVPDEKWPTPADCAHIIRARGERT
jgi:hypothetical protein